MSATSEYYSVHSVAHLPHTPLKEAFYFFAIWITVAQMCRQCLCVEDIVA